MNPTRTESIKLFLNASTHPELANLYSYNMEVQVNVAQDGGERVDGNFKGRQWHGWTDGLQTWKSFRIPYKANTVPEYEDKEIKFDLAAHVEGIGMTGWDWVSRKSKWVAFDFDAISGHSEKHERKLSNAELKDIEQRVADVPWVSVRHSTSGKGLHLYVFLPDIDTKNHTEHAALARAILGMLSAQARCDFQSKVDACGGNMWVWHRKMIGTDGLKLIKNGEMFYDVPSNWRDHIQVISGNRRKILPEFVDAGLGDLFDELSGQRSKTPLDDEHHKLITWLRDNNCHSWWDADHWMLVTHTHHLKRAHAELGMKGFFETNSEATDLMTQNCFCFPIRRGGWGIRRYTPGISEHPSWDQDGQGWTRCLSGDTEILTDKGIFQIQDLVDTSVNLLVKTPEGSKWIKSRIKHFGKARVATVKFAHDFSVKATMDHEWMYVQSNGVFYPERRKFTHELSAKSTQVPYQFQELPVMDLEGYAHGFVFGDGWLHSRGNHTDVELYGGKQDLLDLLLEYGHLCHREKYGEKIPCVRGMPNHWKDIPEKYSKEYAFGFIMGLCAADSSVRETISLKNKHKENLEKVRKLCQFVGLQTYRISQSDDCWVLRISKIGLDKQHFLRMDQQSLFTEMSPPKAIRVEDIHYPQEKDQKIDVYCAEVPIYHNFTLANGIVTGNCFINKEPDLANAARANAGAEHPNGGFQFREAELAQNAAKALGTRLELPNRFLGRRALLKEHKDGRLIMEMEHRNDDTADGLDGWICEKDKWKKVFNVKTGDPYEAETGKYDDLVRHLVSTDGMDCGWVVRSDNQWRDEPLVHVKSGLKAIGYSPKEVETIIGSSIFKAWTLVNKPFQPEIPGDRQWNRNAAQFRFNPAAEHDNNCPTWMKILNHCGKGLDSAIKENAWCKANAILTGGDYLKCWIASMFQLPLEPLPYLFFYGPQNSGKSIFHEALSLLVTHGVVRADTALTSAFNGELANAIACVIEETDLRRDLKAANKIKDYVTAKQLSIRALYQTPYMIPNSTHWIQCSNEHLACPIFPGDTRITMSYVDSLKPEDLIPKRQLIPLLEKEAPYFLAEVLSLELPPSPDRLNLPVIMTDEKALVEKANRSLLEVFIEERCHHVTGKLIKYSEFYEVYRGWLEPKDADYWTKNRVGKELPPKFPKGRLMKKGAHYYLGNISWQPYNPEDSEMTKIVVKNERLYIEGTLTEPIPDPE